MASLSTGEQVTHTFTTAGDLAIVLIVQNSCGARDIESGYTRGGGMHSPD